MRPMDMDLLERYWAKLNASEPLFDFPSCYFGDWSEEYSEEQGQGMIDRKTGELNGPVRLVQGIEKNLLEASMMQGKKFGLGREIYETDVLVSLFKDDDAIAYFMFDSEFNVKGEKIDPDGLLDDLSADDFKLTSD